MESHNIEEDSEEEFPDLPQEAYSENAHSSPGDQESQPASEEEEEKGKEKEENEKASRKIAKKKRKQKQYNCGVKHSEGLAMRKRISVKKRIRITPR